MNDVELRAFFDELTVMKKEAFFGKALSSAGKWVASRPGAALGWAKKQPGQFAEAGRRMLHPVKSVKEGWRHMTPGKQLEHMKRTGAPQADIAKYTQGMGKHITRGAKSTHLPGRAAEALSRRGWTGKGDVTKYIPGWSQKGMYTGFGALSGKSVYDAAKQDPSRTGSGGLFETGFGEALGTGAFIAGTGGLGILPATAMWLASQQMGSRAGRVVDRLRGGANVDTAVNAPTPEAAQEMISNLESQSPKEQQQTLETLRRYYG